MKFRRSASLLLACLWSALCFGHSASADVVAGDVIDDTFELLDFRYGEVVLGVIGNARAGATVTLEKSVS